MNSFFKPSTEQQFSLVNSRTDSQKFHSAQGAKSRIETREKHNKEIANSDAKTKIAQKALEEKKLKLDYKKFWLGTMGRTIPKNVLLENAKKLTNRKINNITENDKKNLNFIIKKLESYSLTSPKNINILNKLKAHKKKILNKPQNSVMLSTNKRRRIFGFDPTFTQSGEKKKFENYYINLKRLQKMKERSTNNNIKSKIDQKMIPIKKYIKKKTGLSNNNLNSPNLNSSILNQSAYEINLDDEFQKLKNNNVISDLNRLNNNKINRLFNKDAKLFSKFKIESPYSEYDFLFGIDQKQTLNKEKTESYMIIASAAAMASMIAVPAIYATMSFGMIPAGGPVGPMMGAAKISILITKYTLDSYRELKRSNWSKSIIFCTKYMPFQGFDCFRSSLYAKCHKIFYYDNYPEETNPEEKYNQQSSELYKFITNLEENEEKNFIIKNLQLKKYCDDYTATELENAESEWVNHLNLTKNLGITKSIQDTIDGIKSYLSHKTFPEYYKQKEVIANLEKKLAESFTKNDAEDAHAEGASAEGASAGVPPHLGGAQNEILSSLRNNTNNKIKKQKTTKVYYNTNEQVMKFRLNHIIVENYYLLTSGDISIKSLFDELSEIINLRSTWGTVAAPLSHKVPFFVNDYLIDQLKSLYVYTSFIHGSAQFVRYGITKFISDYIDSFMKFYLISKYNIKLLIENPKNLKPDGILLEKLFNENLSWTGIGSIGKDKSYGRYSTISSDIYRGTLKALGYNVEYLDKSEIMWRDKINYYCILMKYSYIALDHICKKFKLNIIKYDDTIYNRVNNIEKEISEFITSNKSNSIFGKTKMPQYVGAENALNSVPSGNEAQQVSNEEQAERARVEAQQVSNAQARERALAEDKRVINERARAEAQLASNARAREQAKRERDALSQERERERALAQAKRERDALLQERERERALEQAKRVRNAEAQQVEAQRVKAQAEAQAKRERDALALAQERERAEAQAKRVKAQAEAQAKRERDALALAQERERARAEAQLASNARAREQAKQVRPPQPSNYNTELAGILALPKQSRISAAFKIKNEAIRRRILAYIQIE